MEDYGDFEPNRKESSILLSNLIFMILAFLFIGSSFLMQMYHVGLKTSIVFTQYILILIPILIVMKVKNIDIKRAFRLNKISLNTTFKVILITLTCVPIAYFLNLLVNVILIKLDLFQIQNLDVGTGGLNFFIMFFFISITPGICEEIFFRGLMLSGYRNKTKTSTSFIVTGFLFALFHFNIQNFMLPFFLGIILALLVYITDTIYSSMIAHGLFNAIGLLFMYLPTLVGESELAPTDAEASIQMLEQSAPLLLGSLFVVSLIAAMLLVLLINWLKVEHVKVEVGDTLYIKGKVLNILGVDADAFVIENEYKEEKTISNRILVENSYKIKKAKTKMEYGKISPWNIIFVGTVVILYIGLAVLSYT